MKGVKPMKKKRKGSRIGKGKRGKTRPFPAEFRLKLVRLYVEEGYPRSLIAKEFNVVGSSVGRWARQYRAYGEQGLQPKVRSSRRAGVPDGVKAKIVDLKRSNPSYGTRRISDVLKRFSLIRTSPTTVRKTLTDEGLITTPKRKPKKNPAKPRFFEHATPNQLWQTDIMTFRLAGRNAYLIGYLDDYSRYITACGFYRSQTAEHVLETYRLAISEYGVPREMLTDNGRQYTNWRGSTRFERELKKDRVKHIKSRPHHPMTLGKIERFWKTIQTEFFHRGSSLEASRRPWSGAPCGSNITITNARIRASGGCVRRTGFSRSSTP
jgi:transposase InsO family protein